MEGEYDIYDPRLRAAMLKGFGSRCFYTGQKVTEINMVIDHVVPKNKGGKNSVFNYALTTKLLNTHKATILDEEKIKPILYIIETVYAPRVLKYLSDKKCKGASKGIRKTLYVNNKETWNNIRDKANEQGKSVSSYLMDSGNSQMDRIESKLDLLLGSLNPSVEVEFLDDDSIFPGKVIISASEILDKMKPQIKSDKVILKETLENKFFEPEKLVEKAIKLKEAQVGWVNPLLNSKLAPKKG